MRPTDPVASTLAFVAAVALEDAVGTFGAKAMIKWPNDLLINGGKLSGILLERVENAVVVGFGVNLAAAPVGLPYAAAAFPSIGLNAPDPDIFAEALAEAFGRWLGIWRGQGFEPVRARWLDRAHPKGTPLTARLADGSSYEGLFDGLDRDGALNLRLADGSSRAIHAGDIFLL